MWFMTKDWEIYQRKCNFDVILHRSLSQNDGKNKFVIYENRCIIGQKITKLLECSNANATNSKSLLITKVMNKKDATSEIRYKFQQLNKIYHDQKIEAQAAIAAALAAENGDINEEKDINNNITEINDDIDKDIMMDEKKSETDSAEDEKQYEILNFEECLKNKSFLYDCTFSLPDECKYESNNKIFRIEILCSGYPQISDSMKIQIYEFQGNDNNHNMQDMKIFDDDKNSDNYVGFLFCVCKSASSSVRGKRRNIELNVFPC